MTAGRVLPLEPGWWWAVRGGECVPRVVGVEIDVTGLYVMDDGSEVSDARFVWIAPVSAIGSVPPEVYARDVLGPFAHTRQDVVRTLTAHGLTLDDAERVVGSAT